MDQETVLDHDLIEAVRRHPEIYRQNKKVEFFTWYSIAEQINSDSQTCQSKWSEIQYSYAYIRDIIQDRWELESVLQAHPKTSMYFDGSLNFLDPYVNNIKKKIPKHIPKRYEWINSYFKVYSKSLIARENSMTLVTQERVQAALAQRKMGNQLDTPNMKYLMELVGTTITQCIMKFKNDKENCQATNVARNKKNPIEPIIQEEINFEDSKMTDPLGEITVDDYTENMSVNVGHNAVLESATAGSEDILTNKVIMISSDNYEMIDGEPGSENVTEFKSEGSNECILETDTKSFFNDLVDFVSENFTLEKQKELQRRVTLLVSELYADNDPE